MFFGSGQATTHDGCAAGVFSPGREETKFLVLGDGKTLGGSRICVSIALEEKLLVALAALDVEYERGGYRVDRPLQVEHPFRRGDGDTVGWLSVTIVPSGGRWCIVTDGGPVALVRTVVPADCWETLVDAMGGG